MVYSVHRDICCIGTIQFFLVSTTPHTYIHNTYIYMHKCWWWWWQRCVWAMSPQPMQWIINNYTTTNHSSIALNALLIELWAYNFATHLMYSSASAPAINIYVYIQCLHAIVYECIFDMRLLFALICLLANCELRFCLCACECVFKIAYGILTQTHTNTYTDAHRHTHTNASRIYEYTYTLSRTHRWQRRIGFKCENINFD